MSRLGNIFYSSCDKVTGFIEKRSLLPLPVRERFQLALHLKICAACRRYLKQSKVLDSLLQNPDFTKVEHPQVDTNASLKSKIKEAVNGSIK